MPPFAPLLPTFPDHDLCQKKDDSMDCDGGWDECDECPNEAEILYTCTQCNYGVCKDCVSAIMCACPLCSAIVCKECRVSHTEDHVVAYNKYLVTQGLMADKLAHAAGPINKSRTNVPMTPPHQHQCATVLA